MSKDAKRKRLLHSYYVGEPTKVWFESDDRLPKIGQDAFGNVHCICWGMIYNRGDMFSKPNEYPVGRGGGISGRATTISEAKKMLHSDIVRELTMRVANWKVNIAKAEAALKVLGTDPKNLDKFEGPHSDDTPLAQSLNR